VRLAGVLVVVLCTAAPTFVAAQAIKCTDASGHTTYGDEPCEKGFRGDLVDTTPAGEVDGSSLRREAAHTRAQRSAEARAEAHRQAQPASAQREASSYERDMHRRELQMTVDSPTATRELRQAAAAELSQIDRGVGTHYSAADQSEMDGLKQRLYSGDPALRRAAQTQLEDIRDRSESPEYLQRRDATRQAQADAEAAHKEAGRRQALEANLRAQDNNQRVQEQYREQQLITGGMGIRTPQGMIDPQTGTSYVRKPGGYVNTTTGQFVPGP
jgi:uncharacterized protein DUF4124